MKASRVVVAVALISGACSSDTPRPPGATPTNTPAPDGATPVGMDGGGPSGTDAGREANVVNAPVCASGKSIGVGSMVAGLPSDVVAFSILRDETLIAWSDGTGVVQIASRATAADPFGPPTTLVEGPFAATIPALRANGLGLAVVAPSRKTVRFFARATRSDAFAATDDSYTNLMALPDGAGEDFVPIANVFNVVLSSDRREAFFTLQQPDNMGASVFASSSLMPDEVLTRGVAQTETQLRVAPGDKYRFSTGISSDDLTLFYFDENSATSHMATRTSRTEPFTLFEDIGARLNVAPNAACSRVYYIDGMQVMVASRM
jgi:hypothetical protein